MFFFVVGLCAFADILYLKNGGKVEGVVEEKDNFWLDGKEASSKVYSWL